MTPQPLHSAEPMGLTLLMTCSTWGRSEVELRSVCGPSGVHSGVEPGVRGGSAVHLVPIRCRSRADLAPIVVIIGAAVAPSSMSSAPARQVSEFAAPEGAGGGRMAHLVGSFLGPPALGYGPPPIDERPLSWAAAAAARWTSVVDHVAAFLSCGMRQAARGALTPHGGCLRRRLRAASASPAAASPAGPLGALGSPPPPPHRPSAP